MYNSFQNFCHVDLCVCSKETIFNCFFFCCLYIMEFHLMMALFMTLMICKIGCSTLKFNISCLLKVVQIFLLSVC